MAVPTVFSHGCNIDLSLSGNRVAMLDTLPYSKFVSDIKQNLPYTGLPTGNIQGQYFPSIGSTVSVIETEARRLSQSSTEGDSVIRSVKRKGSASTKSRKRSAKSLRSASSCSRSHAKHHNDEDSQSVCSKEISLISTQTSAMTETATNSIVLSDVEDRPPHIPPGVSELAQKLIQEAKTKTGKSKKKKKKRAEKKKSRRRCDWADDVTPISRETIRRKKMGNSLAGSTNLAILQGTAKPISVQPAPPTRSFNSLKRQISPISMKKHQRSTSSSPPKLTYRSPSLSKPKTTTPPTERMTSSFIANPYGAVLPKRLQAFSTPISCSVDTHAPLARKLTTFGKSGEWDDELKKMTKIYLSEKQSANIQEQGGHFPCAPPGTPHSDMLKKYEYVPSMGDIRSQRALKVRLEYFEKLEQKKKQDLKEAKLKQDKINAKEKIREKRRRQRREIYAINEIMTELEHGNFRSFCQTNGIPCDLS